MTDASRLADAATFGAQALQLAADATSVFNAAYGLAGNFGRYDATTANPAITSETQALAVAAASRASVAAAAAALTAAVQVSGDVPAAVQALLDATLAALPNPADQVRACATLAGFAGAGPLAMLCRRLSVIALAIAASNQTPASYDDAQALLQQVADAIDDEITAAGDAGDDPSFNALRQLRGASVADLTARGADLAPLKTVSYGDSLPHLLVAAQLYGDATRADELVRRIDPVHPLFMPVTMTVLAS